MLKQVSPHFFWIQQKRVATTKRLEKAFIQHKQYQYSTNSTSGRCSKQTEIQSYVSKKPRSLFCWKGKIPPWVPLWAADVLTPICLAVALVLSIHRWYQTVLAPQTEPCKVVKDDHGHHKEHANCILIPRCACHHGAFSSPSFWRVQKDKEIAQIFVKKSLHVSTSILFFCFFTLTPMVDSSLRTWLGFTAATGSAKQRNSPLFSPAKICQLHCHVLPFINIIQLPFLSQLQGLGLLTLNIRNYVYKAKLQNNCVWASHEKWAQNTISCNSMPQ